MSDTNRAVQSKKMVRGLRFVFKKKGDCTIRVAKTKALISFAVTAKLICAIVFAQAFCWFSCAVAHFTPLSMIDNHIKPFVPHFSIHADFQDSGANVQKLCFYLLIP